MHEVLRKDIAGFGCIFSSFDFFFHFYHYYLLVCFSLNFSLPQITLNLKVVSIVNNIAKVCGIALDPLYTEIVWPLNTIYGHAFNAFESIIMDGKSLFSLLFQSSDNILVIQEKESPIEKDEKEGPIEKDEKDEKEGPIKKDEKESPIEKNENESPIEKDEAIHNGINLESTQLVQASHEAKNVESTNACEKTVLSGSILEKAEQIIIQRLNLPPISFVVELEMVCEGEEVSHHYLF